MFSSKKMPLQFEMLLSASPPLFSHSALADFHYAYNHRGMPTSRPNHTWSHTLGTTNKLCQSLNSLNMNGKGQVLDSPIRPILIIKSSSQDDEDEDLSADTDLLDMPLSPSGRDKKRVWFADDKGLALTHVRVMSEPSDCPPRWTDSFLEHVSGFTCGGFHGLRGPLKRRPGTSNSKLSGIKPKDGGSPQPAKWKVSFPQPASDYVAFRQTIDQKCVALENVIVRDDGEEPSPLVTGTVKVKNIAYDKSVTVRFTFDRWMTHKDSICTFVPSGIHSSGSSGPMYDTFSFTEVIPTTAEKYQTVEFCVLFNCNGNEYWDNNGGCNYRLNLVPDLEDIKEVSIQNENIHETPKFEDAVKAEFDRWTEFASWNHLINDSPYW